MKTSKPFSTISYNTADFLKSKLDELVTKRVISFYSFVEHYPEEDEKKKHKHLLIIPNGQVQTDQITDLLQEMDLQNPLLPPLGVMPWRSSKFDDWFLYTCHDTGYLATKGQTREHHYQENDFICSNEDYMHELVTTIDYAKYRKSQEFFEQAKKGVPFMELLAKGQIPAPQFNQWRSMYDYIHNSVVTRNGRETHTPIEDDDFEYAVTKDKKIYSKETGEIYE